MYVIPMKSNAAYMDFFSKAAAILNKNPDYPRDRIRQLVADLPLELKATLAAGMDPQRIAQVSALRDGNNNIVYLDFENPDGLLTPWVQLSLYHDRLAIRGGPAICMIATKANSLIVKENAAPGILSAPQLERLEAYARAAFGLDHSPQYQTIIVPKTTSAIGIDYRVEQVPVVGLAKIVAAADNLFGDGRKRRIEAPVLV